MVLFVGGLILWLRLVFISVFYPNLGIVLYPASLISADLYTV